MFRDQELENLIFFPEVWPMICGWRVIKRAGWTDVTPQRPHGLSYALILQDESSRRLLGFDNSHGFDGAAPMDPFDHEHRFDRVGERLRYDFISAGALISDFFDRLVRHCTLMGVSSDMVDIQI